MPSTGCGPAAGPWATMYPSSQGGGENMAPYYYLAGASGFTTGMANLTLPMSIEMHNAGMRRHVGTSAMELRDWFEPLTTLRGELGTPMLKAGLEMMGLAGGPMRGRGATPTGRRPVHQPYPRRQKTAPRSDALLKKKGVF